MSETDKLINQNARKAMERAEYYENYAIPHFSGKLHRCLDDENISMNKEIADLKKQLDEKEMGDTEKQLLLESLIRSNENSNFESIRESVEKDHDTIDELDSNRSKPNSRKKKQGTTN